MEIRKGEPLTGPAGQIFNQLLKLTGIARDECLITNVFDFHLEDNDIASITAGAKEKKDWPGYDLPPVLRGKFILPEYANQLDRLAAEIKRADPAVIVPMGGVALWALTGNSWITKARGAVDIAVMTAPGYKIVPTYHPSFIIHTYNAMIPAAADITRALLESETPKKVAYTPRELWLEPTLADIREFKRTRLAPAALISVDIETKPKFRQITAVGFSSDSRYAISIPFTRDEGPDRNYWADPADEVEAWRLVREICGMPNPKLLQNGPYDIIWLWKIMGIAVKNYQEDTRLMHHALYPELPKSLEFMGSLYAKEFAWKNMRQGGAIKRDE